MLIKNEIESHGSENITLSFINETLKDVTRQPETKSHVEDTCLKMPIGALWKGRSRLKEEAAFQPQ